MIRTDSHIYLDYSATTPLDPEVAEVIGFHQKQTYGNASSVHAFGRSAKVLLEESREIVAQSINAEPAEVFFTSGGTEADNHAVAGAALAGRRSRRRNGIVVSAIEHHAVLDCADYLSENGFDVVKAPVNGLGVLDMDAFPRYLNADSVVVSVMHANNETGVIQPVAAAAKAAHAVNAAFHADAVQTFGKIPVDVDALGVDLLSLSSHKIYGPKGIGAIYIRRETAADALLHGGSQERKNRAGTENIPLIAGFAKAVELAEHNRKKLYDHASHCKSIMTEAFRNEIPGIIVNGDQGLSLPHILSISLDSSYYDIEGETLLLKMDLNGVAVSSGSACTSGSVQPSHVLTAMGRDERTTKATVRFSFGKFTTIDEIEKTVRIFCTLVEPFRKQ